MMRLNGNVKLVGLAVGVVVALAAPGTAGASLGEQCSGASIDGQGTPLQAKDQASLTSSFNRPEDHSPRACSGTQGVMLEPKVSYAPGGDLAALESWGVNGHAADFSASNAFIATDEPPNAAQREEIVAHSSEPHWGSLQTIPLQQYAVAIVVHLPTGCFATSSLHGGFLVFNNSTFERLWKGEIENWTEIVDGGDRIVKNTSACEPHTLITRVVSLDNGGAAWTLKKYLYLANKEKNVIGSLGWRELAEGSANAQWPGSVTRPSEGGEEAVDRLVAETPSSIGVVNMGAALVGSLFGGAAKEGGEWHNRFMALLQNNGLASKAEYGQLHPGENRIYCRPLPEYTNSGVAGLPPSTFSLWNALTTKTTEPEYPLCGLSYILALTKYSDYPGATEAEATTVNNYLRFVFSDSRGGGQEEFHPALSTQLLEESSRGVEAIQY